MKPGLELDALIAEKVFGLKLGEHDSPSDIQYYSTDIVQAWKIVEKHVNEGKWLGIEFYPTIGLNRDGLPYEAHWRVSGMTSYEHRIIADTAAHAICLGALKAVGVEIDDT